MKTHLNIVTLRINSTRPSGVPLEQRVMEPQVALLSPPAGGEDQSIVRIWLLGGGPVLDGVELPEPPAEPPDVHRLRPRMIRRRAGPLEATKQKRLHQMLDELDGRQLYMNMKWKPRKQRI